MKNEIKKWTGENTSILYSVEDFFGNRSKKTALSRKTAAELYGFGEFLVDSIDFTVPVGYNNIKLTKNEHINIRSNKYDFQLEQYDFDGMIFNVYSPERTIVEIVKEAKGNFNDVIIKTIKNFFNKIKYNYKKLIEAAKEFKVEREMKVFIAAFTYE